MHRLGRDARNVVAVVSLLMVGVGIGRNWWRIDQVEAQVHAEVMRADKNHDQIKDDLRREMGDKLDVLAERMNAVSAELAMLRADFAYSRARPDTHEEGR
jgi:hypothetical protein